MGRWSRRLARRFVAWLAPERQRHWLDVGCGTGALTDAVCRNADPASVVACDPAEPLLEYARRHAADRRASFIVGGVGSLPARSGGYDHVTSLLALNFFPAPAAAVAELRSLAADSGCVSACVWDYAEGMEYLRRFWDAAKRTQTGVEQLDEAVRFPLCRRDALVALFDAAGLADLACDGLEIETRFDGFDDYWQPLLGATGPAPSYVAALDAPDRAALADRLDRSLPRAADGTIALRARAWAVRGRRK